MTKYSFKNLRQTNPKEYFRLRWQEYKKTINRSQYWKNLDRKEYFKERYKRGQIAGISSTNASRARKFKKDECAICKTKKGLVVHHINENQEDNRPENIQTLCWSCHNSHHKNAHNS